MKAKLYFTTSCILIAFSSNLFAGAVPASLSSEALFSPPPSESVSFGLNYDQGQRMIRYNSGDAEQLDSRSYSFYVGYDLSKWCTFFATIGTSAAKLAERQKLGDAKSKWSAGINANLWQIDIEAPPLISGRICLKPSIELAQFNSRTGNNTVEWTDISGAVLLAYEKTIEDPKYNLTDFHGYSVYAGPAFSVIDGSNSGRSNFQEDRKLGVIGGLDFFITRNLSIGGQLQSFDEVSFGGNIRYHF